MAVTETIRRMSKAKRNKRILFNDPSKQIPPHLTAQNSYGSCEIGELVLNGSSPFLTLQQADAVVSFRHKLECVA